MTDLPASFIPDKLASSPVALPASFVPDKPTSSPVASPASFVPDTPPEENYIRSDIIQTLKDNAAMTDSLAMTPEHASKLMELAQKSGVGAGVIAQDPEAAARIINRPNFNVLAAQAPVTAQALVDPSAMAVMGNDGIAEMRSIEKAAQAHTLLQAFIAGLEGSLPGLAEQGKMPGIVVPPEAPFAYQVARTAGGLTGDIGPMVLATAASTFATGNPIAGAAGGFAIPGALKQILIDHYQKGDIESSGDLMSRIHSAGKEALKGAVIGAATAGGGALAGKVLEGPLADATAELSAGTAHTVMSAGKTAGEFTGLTAGSAATEGKLPTGQEMALNGLTLGAFQAIGAVASKVSAMRMETMKTAENQALLKAVSDGIDTSKFRDRAPELHREVINKILGPQAISVDKFNQVFHSAGIDPVRAAKELGLWDSYSAAALYGGDVTVPMGTFLAQKMDAYRASMLQHTKAEGGLSPEELKEQNAADTKEMEKMAGMPLEEGKTPVIPAASPIDSALREMGGPGAEPLKGLGDKATAELAKDAQKAREMAEKMLLKPLTAKLKKEYAAKLDEERVRLTKEAEAQIANDPIQNAVKSIEDEERSALHNSPEGARGRKSITSNQIRNDADRYILNELSETQIDRYQVYAEKNGFSSGDELLKGIATSSKPEVYIKDYVDTGMKKFDNLKDPAVLKDNAIEALHTGNERGELIALEEQALRGLRLNRDVNAGITKQNRENASKDWAGIKELASTILDRQPIGAAGKFRNYVSAELAASNLTGKLLGEGDIEGALAAKRRQLVAHALTAESIRLKSSIGKNITYLNRQLTAPMKSFKNQKDFVQAASLLSRFGGVRKDFKPGDQTESLAQWSARKGKVGSPAADMVNIPDWLQNDAGPKDFKSLRPSQLQEVVNAVKNIKTIANRESVLGVAWGGALVDDKARELAATAAKSMAELNRVSRAKPDTSATPWQYDFVRAKDFFLANDSVVKPETVLRMLQNFAPSGPWTDIFNNYSHAKDAEDAGLFKAKEEYSKIFSAYSPKELKNMQTRPLSVPELNGTYSRADLFMMLLNRGNAGNLKVLTEGRGMSVESLDAALNAHLDKRDFDTARKVWDWLDSYRPQIGDLHEKLTGFQPQWVQPQSFRTNYGEYAGGYFPLKADPNTNVRAYSAADADRALNDSGQAGYRAATKQGFTKERSQYANYVVSLDIGNIHRHVYDVVHDLAMREWILDSQKIFNHPDVQDAIKNALGQGQNLKMKDWIFQEAGQTGNAGYGALNNTLSWLRQKTMQTQIVDNLAVLAMQTHSILAPIGADPVNFGWRGVFNGVLKSYYAQVTDPAGYAAKVATMKTDIPSMNFRDMEMEDRDLNSQWRKAWGNQPVNDFSRRCSIGFIHAMDRFITQPIAMEAKNIGLNLFNGDEQKANDYAASIIRRSQPIQGARVGELAPVFRNDNVRTFAMIGSFFNNVYNAGVEQAAKIQAHPLKNSPEFISTAMAMAVMPVMIKNLIHAGIPDDEEKAKKWLKGFATYPADLCPFNVVHAAADHTMNKILDLPDTGFKAGDVSPAFGMFDQYLKTAGVELSDSQNKERKLEAVTSLGGYALGIPRQYNTWFWNLVDTVHNGMNPKPEDILKRRPVSERE